MKDGQINEFKSTMSSPKLAVTEKDIIPHAAIANARGKTRAVSNEAWRATINRSKT